MKTGGWKLDWAPPLHVLRDCTHLGKPDLSSPDFWPWYIHRRYSRRVYCPANVPPLSQFSYSQSPILRLSATFLFLDPQTPPATPICQSKGRPEHSSIDNRQTSLRQNMSASAPASFTRPCIFQPCHVENGRENFKGADVIMAKVVREEYGNFQFAMDLCSCASLLLFEIIISDFSLDRIQFSILQCHPPKNPPCKTPTRITPQTPPQPHSPPSSKKSSKNSTPISGSPNPSSKK